MFSNVFMPFCVIIVVEDGFESGNDRLVTWDTIKCMGELVSE